MKGLLGWDWPGVAPEDDEPIEDVDAYLRANGYDPDALRERFRDLAARLIERRRKALVGEWNAGVLAELAGHPMTRNDNVRLDVIQAELWEKEDADRS